MEKNKSLHKLKGLPPIFCINLDDKPDRWKYMDMHVVIESAMNKYRGDK